jgi:SpoIID/LytB domain protein
MLTAAVVTVPVVSFGASPKPVAPRVERMAMPAAVASVGARTAGAVSTLTKAVSDEADLLGVTFDDAAGAKAAAVAVRTQTAGTWGPWEHLDLTDSAPDPGTREAAQARVGTEPLAIEGADEVQVRVTVPQTAAIKGVTAVVIDGGSSAADAAPGSTPAAAAQALAAKPTILTRAQWGADERLRTCSPDYVARISGAIVHHTVNGNTYASGDAAGLIRGIYAYHTKSLGWCDIGYNFIVDRFGRIWEGRYGGDFKNVIGAQTQGFNAQTVGVASLGTHQSTVSGAVAPSSATVSAMSKVIGWKASLNNFDPSTSVTYTSAGNPRYPAGTTVYKPRVSGHRDFYPTECPGDLLQSKLPTIRTSADAVATAGASVPAATVQKETYTRPSGSTLTLSGRGFGHGRGMSQWGAYGAATKGLTWQQIVGFYYPNTTIASIGNPALRVRLTAVGSGGTQVAYTDGLQLTNGTTTVSLFGRNADGTVRQRWRIVPDGSGLTLQWLERGQWRSTSSWKAVSTPLTLKNPTSGVVRVVMPGGSMRDYRGDVRTHRYGSAAMSVNVVTTQSYLMGVVPAEMPASWSAAALQAQAVAARSYAAYQRAHQPSGSLFDTCDTTSCQVYRGAVEYTSTGSVSRTNEDSRSNSAVAATLGSVVHYQGAIALTEFSASNGGYTAGSSIPYQVVKSDPYDGAVTGNPSTWTASVAITSIESAYAATGSFRALRIESRNGGGQWGGRITSITIVGSKSSTTVSGESFRARFGLRSSWFVPTSAPAVSAPAYPKDLNLDQRADLLAIDPANSLQLLKGDGTGGFSASRVATNWGSLGLVANIGPWDQDNRADVIERDAGVLYYHPGNGAGGLFPRQRISSGWDVVDLIVGPGDFDGDGHTDFLARRKDTGWLVVYRGDGAGHVINTKYLFSGWGQFRLIIAPGDITGDRRPDVLAVRASDNAMFVYAGNGAGGLSTTQIPVAGSWAGYSALMGVGDVTADGRNDLVGRRSSDGAVVILKGDGMGGFAAGTASTAWASWTRWTP